MRIFLTLKQSLPRTISILLIVIIFCNQTSLANQRLKTGISVEESQGKKITLIPESILDTELLLEGDYFSAWINNDSSITLALPTGSRVIGSISQISKSKSFNRGARINVEVTNILYPDGTLVKASGKLSSSADWQEHPDPSPLKNQAVKFVSASSKAIAASMVGAVDTIQYTGLGTAIMTSGLSVAVGAGLGLGLGLFGLARADGQEIVSSGFYAVPFKVDTEIIAATTTASIGQKLEPFNIEQMGINVQVKDIHKLYSKDFGDFLVFNINLTNHSDRKLFLGDFVLSSNNNIIPILNNPLISNDGFRSLALEASSNFKISFSLGDLRRAKDYKLMLLDAVTQEIVANTDVDISSFL